MPRRRMMDMMMYRGRYPRRMMGMRDRGMYDSEHYGVRSGEHYPMDGNYSNPQYNDERGRRDYESSRQSDMGYDNMDMRRRRNARGQYMSDRAYENEMDGHYPMGQGSTYYPIEAMGRFTGYWGEPESDYARGGRYDMRGRDYGYDYAGDYGEKLTKEELEEWKKKLLKEVDEKEKQFFTKEHIGQKARQMGVEMKDYNEEELVVATAMVYTDYCKTAKKYIGNNMDFFIEIARDWLEDKDSELKGGEKLAVYYDCIIMGE